MLPTRRPHEPRKKFIALVDQALRIAHSAVWLDCIIDRHFLVGFDSAPGLFVIARENSTPRELATLLAMRRVEREAYDSYLLGFQTQAERSQYGGHLQ